MPGLVLNVPNDWTNHLKKLRPVQNHLDSYKMYNQILQCLLILLINFILYLNINLKNILKIFTPRPPPTKIAAKSFSNHSK